MHRPPPNHHPNGSYVDDVEDPLQLGVSAAEIGTWDWDVHSGRVRWTPQMYQLFGTELGRFTTTFENVMALVHPEDRPRVEAKVARALRDLKRYVSEFRIRRPDGDVRWLRCTGRAFPDDRGRAIRMAGVTEDVTHDKRGRPPQQVEAVERLANAGGIGFLRSSRKDSRRFAPEQVLEYLRRVAGETQDFEAALAAENIEGCVAVLMDEVGRGNSLDALLDDRVLPAAGKAPRPLLHELLARLPALVSEPRRSTPAFVAVFGHVEDCTAELIECSLRGHGYSVLTPAASNGSAQLVDVIERVRARVVALLARGDSAARAGRDQDQQPGPGIRLVRLQARLVRPGGRARQQLRPQAGRLEHERPRPGGCRPPSHGVRRVPAPVKQGAISRG